jgi:hypothetical protein
MRVQPISVGPVVSRIWQIYRQEAAVLIGTAFILFGVEFLLEIALSGASISIAILFWALTILYQGTVVELVRDIQIGRHTHSVADLVRSVYPVLLPLMGVSVLFAFGVFVGFVLFIVPGVILWVIWSVVAPVTLLERPGVLAAFGRSRELVRGNGWPVFGVIACVALTALVISVAVNLAAISLGIVGREIVQWLVISAIAPLTALSASVLYFALGGDGSGSRV